MRQAPRPRPSPTDPTIVADRLHRAAIRLLRSVRVADSATGLTAPRLSALSVVVFGGPLPIGRLAAAEQVRPPTMSRLVKGLERDGLVTRSRTSADDRVQLVTATARGRRLLEQGRRDRVALLAERMASLTPAQRRVLAEASEILTALEPVERRTTSPPRG